MAQLSYKRLLCLLLGLICTVLLPFPARAVPPAEQNGTVRVGYCDTGDFSRTNDAGDHVGFSFEYLHELSKYTGWQYEIINCGSWENCMAMLQSGQIDLLPGVYQTETRRSILHFPILPMGSLYTALNVRADDKRYHFEDFSSFDGMRVGTIRGTTGEDNLEAYCQENGISVHTVPYAALEDLLDALERGEVDGAVTTHLGRSSPLKCVAQFSPQPFYIAVAQGRSDLLAELNRALTQLNLRNADFSVALYDKYFSASPDHSPVFTKEELAYLAENPVISAAYDASWLPLEYTDPQTGTFDGAVADLFSLIASYTGITFHFIPAEGYQQALDLSQDNTINVVCGVSGNYLTSQRNNINSTQHYLRSPVVMITAGEQAEIHRVGAMRTLPLEEIFAATGEEIVYFDSPSACFEAVLDGTVDALYVNTYVASYWLSLPRYGGLSATTLTNLSMELGIGVSANADPRLFSILDKCVQHVAAEQVDEFILKSSLAPRTITFRDFITQNPLQMLSIVVGAASAVILLLVILLGLNGKRKRQIESLLYRDELTGLWNLNKFCNEVDRRMAADSRQPYALVYLDIKQFRTLNDAQGFAEGDRILIALAKILEAALEPGELCARVSSDQFVLLLCCDDPKVLDARTVSISNQLNDWAREQGRSYRLILVFGVYLADGEEQRDVSLLLDYANCARRSAQVAHRSHTVFYDTAMRQQELWQRTLTDRMQPALEGGEFVAYFQPKVEMHTGRLLGSEALVRWNSPVDGLIPPGRFIPFFEKNGFVVEIDLYIFELVCKSIRRWLDEGYDVYPVSSNFSRMHFDDQFFPDRLVEIADRYRVPHHLLELEVTESVFIGNLDKILSHFNRLKDVGFPISIDDFGSGYSSLGLLQQFSVDVIKLDRTFIEKGMLGAREQAVVRGVVDMARNLEMQVVCEGVETIEQVEILREIGCTIAQGYFYARPMPQEELEALLRGPVFD